jgi:hypothetical protein
MPISLSAEANKTFGGSVGERYGFSKQESLMPGNFKFGREVQTFVDKRNFLCPKNQAHQPETEGL